MKVLYFGIVVVGVVILFVVLFSFALLCYVTKPKRTSMEHSMQREKSKNLWGEFDVSEREACDIVTDDGYLLHGILMKRPGRKYVIVTHGYTYNRWGSVKYANMFYHFGYNVYLYDLRHHGENANQFCSMGHHEKNDILAVAAYLRKRFGEDIEIGLHGESLGAASSMLALGESDQFAFCVADCGFADLGQLLEYLCKKLLHLPEKISHLASFACKVRYGYRLDELQPVEAVRKNVRTPILFIHGKEDDFIPPEHCDKLYDASGVKKERVLFDGAAHAESFQSDKERYYQVVADFLRDIGQI